MRVLLALIAILPAWFLTGVVVFETVNTPDKWGLAAFVPIMCGFYSLIVVYILNE